MKYPEYFADVEVSKEGAIRVKPDSFLKSHVIQKQLKILKRIAERDKKMENKIFTKRLN